MTWQASDRGVEATGLLYLELRPELLCTFVQGSFLGKQRKPLTVSLSLEHCGTSNIGSSSMTPPTKTDWQLAMHSISAARQVASNVPTMVHMLPRRQHAVNHAHCRSSSSLSYTVPRHATSQPLADTSCSFPAHHIHQGNPGTNMWQ